MCDNKLKQMFSEISLEIFWAHLSMGNYTKSKLNSFQFY